MTTFDAIQYKKIEREVYSATATSYEKYGSDTFERLARPLVEGASLKAGHHVLDVACGTGIPSLMAAPLVLPGGTLTGVDLAPGMVELARRKAGERGLKNITFQEADGESLPFPDESFDVVLCNHGLVHMTDRTKALAEMRRILKSDRGTLALSVWSTPDRALAIGIVAKIIREVFPAAVVPGAPMWFDFGAEGALETILSEAGFKEIRTTRHRVDREVGRAEEYWEGVIGISGRLQMLLKNIPDETALSIKSAVLRAAEGFRAGGTIRIPCEEVIAVSRK